MKSKRYCGDSVYAECEGEFVKLTTENGRPDDPSNTIYLKSEVCDALVSFVNESRGITDGTGNPN